MNKINLKEHPILRAYTLLVYHRFIQINKRVFGQKEYSKRSVDSIKRSEDVRRDLHEKAVIILEGLGYTNIESCKILEDECERLVSIKLRKLRDGEVYCGCCREILKREDWEKHKLENEKLHNLLKKELILLSQESMLLSMNKMKEEEVGGKT